MTPQSSFPSTVSPDFAAKEIPFGTYTLDPAHTLIGFEVPHLVVSSIEGRFKKIEGTLTLGKELSDSKVEASVEINSIDTAEINRDNHLKSADFFDAPKFPKMNFVSSSFTGTPDKFKVRGKLTIKGISRDVVFDAALSKQVTDPWGKTRVAISGITKINRQDFGLKWNEVMEAGQVAGNEITILIKAEGIKS